MEQVLLGIGGGMIATVWSGAFWTYEVEMEASYVSRLASFLLFIACAGFTVGASMGIFLYYRPG